MLKKALVPFAAVLSVVVLGGCATASASSNLKLSAGYADNLQTVGARTNTASFPNPWKGGSNVNFKGAGDKFDAGAIRIENPSGDQVTVDQVTVDIGQKHYDLWGSGLKVPANGSLILTQTELGTANPPQPNFDSSEPNAGAATGATGAGSAATPVIHVRINGNTTNFQDTARILNTSGVDKGDLPGSPNESHAWQQIGILNGGSSSNSSLSPLLLFAPLAALMLALFSFIPKLIGALILLAIGWWLASLAARLVVGLLDRLGFGAAAERTGMFGFMGRSTGGAAAAAPRRGTRPSWLIGEIVKWFVFLIFVELAAQALGLAAVSALLHSIILWIPNLVVALLILFLAALAAQFVGRLVRGGAGRNAAFLGSLTEYGIIALAAVVALNQLGIGAVFVDILFAAVVAALALAAGLAFGLGGRNVASQIWRQSYNGVRPQATSPRPTATVSTVKTPTPIESGRQR